MLFFKAGIDHNKTKKITLMMHSKPTLAINTTEYTSERFSTSALHSAVLFKAGMSNPKLTIAMK